MSEASQYYTNVVSFIGFPDFNARMQADGYVLVESLTCPVQRPGESEMSMAVTFKKQLPAVQYEYCADDYLTGKSTENEIAKRLSDGWELVETMCRPVPVIEGVRMVLTFKRPKQT